MPEQGSTWPSRTSKRRACDRALRWYTGQSSTWVYITCRCKAPPVHAQGAMEAFSLRLLQHLHRLATSAHSASRVFFWLGDTLLTARAAAPALIEWP